MDFFGFINSIDFAVIDFIQENLRCQFLDIVMALFSSLGELGGIWILFGIIMIFFKKTRATGVMLLCAVAIGFAIGELGLKHFVARPRPFVQNPEIIPIIKLPSGYSFPSGHSCSSFAAATVIFARHKKLGIFALAVASLIVFSRLYNYVHFPTDVLCGMLLGVVCAVVTIIIFKKTGFDNKLSGGYKK